MFTVEKRYLTVLGRTGDPERAFHSIQGKRRRFFISAYQSWLFNRLLIERLDQLDQLVEGDLAYLHRNGRFFLVEDPEVERARLEAFEISPSGPVYGFQGLLAQGAPGEAEQALIRSEGVELGLFNMPGGLKSRGTRRPYRFPLEDPEMTIQGTEATLAFALPRGSYATLVLRELTKNEEPFSLMDMPG
jgi:tRNA pseudouridine13 synthase